MSHQAARDVDISVISDATGPRMTYTSSSANLSSRGVSAEYVTKQDSGIQPGYKVKNSSTLTHKEPASEDR